MSQIRKPATAGDGPSNVVQLRGPNQRHTYRPSPAQLVRRDQDGLALARLRGQLLPRIDAIEAADRLEFAARLSIRTARLSDANTAIALTARAAHLIARAFVLRDCVAQ